MRHPLRMTVATFRSLREALMIRRPSRSQAAPPARTARTGLIALLLLATFGARTAQAQPQETIEYYGVDALGSVRVVFDQAGNVAARSDYLPFGEAWTPTGNLPPQRLSGQQRDSDEGFDSFNARSYQTRTGRMNAVDPVFAGLFAPQAWNRYAYALNSPINNSDPSGAQTCQTQAVNGGFQGCPTTVTYNTTATAGGRSDPVFWATGGDYTMFGAGNLAGWYGDMEDFIHGFGIFMDDVSEQLSLPAVDDDALSGDEIPACDGCIPYTGAPDTFQKNDDWVTGLVNAGGISLGGLAKSLFRRAAVGLPANIAATFTGRIRTMVLQSDVTAVRYWGGVSGEVGRFLTTRQTAARIATPEAARAILNLPQGATAEALTTFTIPRGATIYVGRVAGGGKGATQIFVPNPALLVGK